MFEHPTHRGLAIRAVDVAAGRVPGINRHENAAPPPGMEPIGYHLAIDAATGLNYMDTPIYARLIGASPAYLARARVIAPGQPLPDELAAKGYRVGESYYLPEEYFATDALPAVWDASEIQAAAAGGASAAPSGIDSPGNKGLLESPSEVRTDAPALSATRREPSEYHADPELESESQLNASQAKKSVLTGDSLVAEGNVVEYRGQYRRPAVPRAKEGDQVLVADGAQLFECDVLAVSNGGNLKIKRRDAGAPTDFGWVRPHAVVEVLSHAGSE